MGTRQGNKLPAQSHTAEDSISAESLSFACLVSIQDQNPKPPIPNHLTNLISLSFQVTYIVRGSGRAQVVGADGRRVLETTVKAGNLFIVPRFFVVSKIADSDGLECVCVCVCL